MKNDGEFEEVKISEFFRKISGVFLKKIFLSAEKKKNLNF